MTEHNGSTDVFKSDKGVWRAHPPSLSHPPLSISLSLYLSLSGRRADPRDVPRRSFSNFPPLALRRVRGQVSLPVPLAVSSLPSLPPSFLYPFFFPLFSFSFSSGATSGTRAPHGCAFAYDLPAGSRLADSEREREREREGGRKGGT